MTASAPNSLRIAVEDYNLAATLSSGQAFRWTFANGAWSGVIGAHCVRLRQEENRIVAETAEPAGDWRWLRHYLQADVNLAAVLATFPDDAPLRAAVETCRGLRLLRQDPWECLASFILSSTKQIVQIRQIVTVLCQRFGDPLNAGDVAAFPTPERLAAASEAELRDCKMGFRAPYLLDAARAVAEGRLNLAALAELPLPDARSELLKLNGVGRKIADCVLLFAYGFPTAFPVDVWIMKALRQLYFPRRRPSPRRLLHFSETHFGPNAGYAQQYLFHYMRTQFEGTPS